jgi:hypothetical protein
MRRGFGPGREAKHSETPKGAPMIGNYPTILFFVNGPVPSHGDVEAAMKLGPNVRFRNAVVVPLDASPGSLEKADGVRARFRPRMRAIRPAKASWKHSRPIAIKRAFTFDIPPAPKPDLSGKTIAPAKSAEPPAPAPQPSAQDGAPGGDTKSQGWHGGAPVGNAGPAAAPWKPN